MADQTVLEINLSALAHNYRALRLKLEATTKFLAVVKAQAYGHDPDPIIHKLDELGVDYYGVAYAQEGAQIRSTGTKKPILLLHPMPVHFDIIVAHNLEPSIYSLDLLREWTAYLASNNIKRYPTHLKFNSGLNRLGVTHRDVDHLAEIFSNTDSIELLSVFSHLAASDDREEAAYTCEQMQRYDDFYTALVQKMNLREKGSAKSEVPASKPWRHLLNTSGVLNYPEGQHDMVRCGIGLYGYGNAPEKDLLLRPVATLKAPIVQLHHLQKGESVGYNRAYVCQHPSIIATLPLGHADGLPRIYGQKAGFVWINGQKAPIVGNVCMDMIMVDVTEIDCRYGDLAIIFDADHGAQSLAEAAGTISYELLTGLSKRIKRVITP